MNIQKIRIVIIVLIVILVWFRFLKPAPEGVSPEVPEIAAAEEVEPAPILAPVVEEPEVVIEEPVVEPEPPAPPVAVAAEVVPEYVALRPEFVKYVAPVSKMSHELNKPGGNVLDDLDVLDSLMSYYHKVFKSMPVAGENREFVDALVGMNAKGVQVLPHDHPAINEKGELVDRWGTAYFFHPMSDKETEIISAGPDRTIFTDDDVQL